MVLRELPHQLGLEPSADPSVLQFQQHRHLARHDVEHLPQSGKSELCGCQVGIDPIVADDDLIVAGDLQIGLERHACLARRGEGGQRVLTNSPLLVVQAAMRDRPHDQPVRPSVQPCRALVRQLPPFLLLLG